jgi:hypothetical protein
MKTNIKNWSGAAKAWLAVGSLAALGLTLMAVSEFPSLRREWRMMRM